jgi:hypothetical protein
MDKGASLNSFTHFDMVTGWHNVKRSQQNAASSLSSSQDSKNVQARAFAFSLFTSTSWIGTVAGWQES